MKRRLLVLTIALAAAVSARHLAAHAANAPSGGQLCVLRSTDFSAFGIAVDAKPEVNLDNDGQSAYCVYRGKSGATGGVELDVFSPAGDTHADVMQTFKTVTASNPGAKYQPEGVPGADESLISLQTPQAGYPAFAANAVQRGNVVFSISLPASAQASRELMALSRLVLTRLAP